MSAWGNYMRWLWRRGEARRWVGANGLPVVMRAMWLLNRDARGLPEWEKCKIYLLKDVLIWELYRSGVPRQVTMHVQRLECWACGGEGCERCDYTGDYRRIWLSAAAGRRGGVMGEKQIEADYQIVSSLVREQPITDEQAAAISRRYTSPHVCYDAETRRLISILLAERCRLRVGILGAAVFQDKLAEANAGAARLRAALEHSVASCQASYQCRACEDCGLRGRCVEYAALASDAGWETADLIRQALTDLCTAASALDAFGDNDLAEQLSATCDRLIAAGWVPGVRQ